MKTYVNEWTSVDFKQVAKRFILLCACVMMIGGGVLTALFWPQITASVGFIQKMGFHPLLIDGDWLEIAFSGGQVLGTDFTGASLTARTALVVFAVLAVALFAGYWLLVAAWLFKTAEKNEMNPYVWGVMALFGNLLAVPCFYGWRKLTRVSCPSCGKMQNRRHTFCQHCGETLFEKCTACGSILKTDDDYCTQCGAKQ